MTALSYLVKIRKCVPSTAMLHGLAARPFQQGQGCFSGKVEAPLRLCNPFIRIDRQGPEESAGGESRHDTYNPCLANITLVSDGSQNVGAQSLIHPRRTDLLRSPKGEYHPILKGNKLKLLAWNISGMLWKQTKYQEGLPTLITAARRSGTISHYNSSWRKWHSWCVGRKVCPLKCSVE